MSTATHLPVLYAILPPVDGRDVVRCASCGLVQFKHPRCVRPGCRMSFTLPAPVAAQPVAVQKPAEPPCKGPDFGFAVKLIRHAHGWTQQNLADAMGCHRQYVVKVERNHVTPQIPMIERIAKALGVTPYALMLIATSPEPGDTVQ